MTKKTSDTIVGLLVAIAGVLCTVGTAPPVWLEAKIGISSNVVFFVGIGLLFVGLGLFIWTQVSPVVTAAPRKAGLQAAKRSDLKEVYSLYFKHFGKDTPTIDQMRRWHARNPNIFQIIVAPDPETRKQKIVASFKAVPLKDD